MNNATRQHFAEVARKQAQLPFHGYIEGEESNLEPIIKHFPKWNIADADKLWCAAFVYYCCIEAGFDIPYSPDECITCSLAGCGGWEEFAMLRLRLSDGLDVLELAEKFPEVSPEEILENARPFEKPGLLKISGSRISFTPKGFLISNALTAEILY